MGLANRKIKKKPLCSHDWTASDFHKIYKLLPPITPAFNKEMPLNVENEYQ
jgi:hypothetical protein